MINNDFFCFNILNLRWSVEERILYISLKTENKKKEY